MQAQIKRLNEESKDFCLIKDFESKCCYHQKKIQQLIGELEKSMVKNVAVKEENAKLHTYNE